MVEDAQVLILHVVVPEEDATSPRVEIKNLKKRSEGGQDGPLPVRTPLNYVLAVVARRQ